MLLKVVVKAVFVVILVCGASTAPIESALNRVKRSLTTICVEIRPSRPQEEPYLMCKGTELPTVPQSVWPLTGFGFKPFAASAFTESAPAVNGNGAASGQEIPTSMYNGKSQPFHPPNDSSYHNSNANDNSDSNNASLYGPIKTAPFSNYESGFYTAPSATPQQLPQHFFSVPQFTYEAQSSPIPTASGDNTQIFKQLKGYQVPPSASPPTAPSTQSAPGFGSPSDTAFYHAPPLYSQQQDTYQVPSSYNNGATNTASYTNAAGQQSTGYASYGAQQHQQQQQQQQSNNGGRYYAQSSSAAALPATEAEKSLVPQAVRAGYGAVPPATPSESAQRAAATPTSTSIVSSTGFDSAAPTTFSIAAHKGGFPAALSASTGFMVPTATTAATATPPATTAPHLKFAETHYGSGEQYSSASGGYSVTPPTIPTTTAITSTSNAPINAADQRYRALIDEDVLGMPDWEFTSEEFDLYRPMPGSLQRRPQTRTYTPVAEGELMQPHWPEPMFPEPMPPQPRTIPLEHMDDPVMQQFYASLHDPSPQFAGEVMAPILGASRSYSPTLPSLPILPAGSSHPIETADGVYGCVSPVAPHSTYTSSAPPSPPPVSAPVLTQYSAASDNTNSAQLPTAVAGQECKPCTTRERGFTPIIIALPCYSQPAPSPPAYSGQYEATYARPIQPNAYGTVGMANPMLGAYRTAPAVTTGGGGLLGMPFGGMGLFGGPRLFSPFGLGRPNLLFPGGLLGSTQHLPPMFPMRTDEGNQNFNNMATIPSTPQQIIPMPLLANGYVSSEDTARQTTVSASNTPSAITSTTKLTTASSELTAATPHTSKTDISDSAESVEENNAKDKSEEDSAEQPSTTPTTKSTTKKVTLGTNNWHASASTVGDSLATQEVPSNLGEEATKTFKTMLQAARTLTNIHKGEVDTTALAENSNQDRVAKEPNAKSSTDKVGVNQWK